MPPVEAVEMQRAVQTAAKSGGMQQESTIVADDPDTMAQIQRGKFKRNEFFGDMSSGASGFGSFKSAVGTASGYFNFATNLIGSLVDSRDEDDDKFYLTKTEYAEIEKKAKSIYKVGNAPYETIRDFLLILCSIDKAEDMKKIADVIELDELTSYVIRDVYAILAIQDLYKISFMASALDALIKLFERFLNASNSTSSSFDADDISSILSSLGSLLGGTGLGGGGSSARLQLMSSSEDALGHFMSELLDGKRIPMPIIAKNPMKQAPSYTGQALFGESPTPLSLMDIDEVFNKKIGVFPKPSNGGGMSSFGMQNFPSLGGSMNLSSMINKLNFGGSETPNTFMQNKTIEIVEKVKSITGATDTETFDLNRADVAIPMQIALSAVNCGVTSTPFGTKTFQEGWQLANHTGNYMQSINPGFMKVIRGLT